MIIRQLKPGHLGDRTHLSESSSWRYKVRSLRRLRMMEPCPPTLYVIKPDPAELSYAGSVAGILRLTTSVMVYVTRFARYLAQSLTRASPPGTYRRSHVCVRVPVL